MEPVILEIDITDPSTLVVGLSVLVTYGLITYNCAKYCLNRQVNESEIELTQSQEEPITGSVIEIENKTSDINSNTNINIDIESQQVTTSTQTDDNEFYNILGKQFNQNLEDYKNKKVNRYINVYE